MIPEKIIREIIERTDIVELVGSFIELKRAGRNFKALCPFHTEKTPSFMVSPDRQMFHCFGCHKGGNAIQFLMEHEGLSFPEAVKMLGEKLGIDVDRYARPGEPRGRVESYHRAMEFAADFYSRMLREGPGSERVREYLDRREISPEIVETFRIGYAPASWDLLYREGASADLPKEAMIQLNLIMRSRGGPEYRDYFRNRIIFPIESLSNRTVGLAGRVLDDSEPKYLNTTESPIYSKGRILYGLNHAKEEIRKSKSAIIVEGYMDYLMLWKNGVRNIAAVCGTSLTRDQARLLARYAKRVYIINDGDRAGIRAAVRAADQLLLESLEIRIVILPEGEDPDSYIRNSGVDALDELINAAPDYFNYLAGEVGEGDRSLYRKNQVIKHLIESISKVEDSVSRELYVQELSNLFNIPVETVRGSLKSGGAPRPREAKVPKLDTKVLVYQKQLFRIGLEGREHAARIIEEVGEEEIEGETFKTYYKALDLALKKNIDIASPDFLGSSENPELANLASEIALLDLPPGPTDELLDDYLDWFRRRSLKRQKMRLQREIEEGERLHGKGSDEATRLGQESLDMLKKAKKPGTKEDA